MENIKKILLRNNTLKYTEINKDLNEYYEYCLKSGFLVLDDNEIKEEPA